MASTSQAGGGRVLFSSWKPERKENTAVPSVPENTSFRCGLAQIDGKNNYAVLYAGPGFQFKNGCCTFGIVIQDYDGEFYDTTQPNIEWYEPWKNKANLDEHLRRAIYGTIDLSDTLTDSNKPLNFMPPERSFCVGQTHDHRDVWISLNGASDTGFLVFKSNSKAKSSNDLKEEVLIGDIVWNEIWEELDSEALEKGLIRATRRILGNYIRKK